MEELAHPVDAVTPDRLELVEDALSSVDGVEVASNELFTSSPLLRDEFGTFEDGNVLLDGGEAHVVATGECRHRRIVAHRSSDDVAASAIGERLEQPVDLFVIEYIYNHLVAR